MKKKIASSTDKNGVSVDDSLHDGLRGMMSEFSVGVEEKFDENSFQEDLFSRTLQVLNILYCHLRGEGLILRGK